MSLIITRSEEETRELAKKWTREKFEIGDLVLLKGEMGAGKTIFVQGMAEVSEASCPVASPTFNKLHLYPGKWTLIHMDLYNVQSLDELEDLGIYDYLESGDGICVVEWWNLYEELFRAKAHLVEIEKDGDTRRIRYERKD